MTAAPPGTWEVFAASIARVGNVPIGEVSPESRLTEDLGLDSLGLAELVTAVIDDFGVDLTAYLPAEEDWIAITAGEVFRTHFGGIERLNDA